jgi:hypothetical protein
MSRLETIKDLEKKLKSPMHRPSIILKGININL